MSPLRDTFVTEMSLPLIFEHFVSAGEKMEQKEEGRRGCCAHASHTNDDTCDRR
jgi:hypothetical protein